MQRLRTATLAAALLLGSFASTASATTITPSTTTDDVTTNGNCTLREAVQAANTDAAIDGCPAGSGADVIQLGTGSYELTVGAAKENANQTGDLDVTAPLTIRGNGAGTSLIDAKSNDRAVDVAANAATTIENLTLTNGAAPTTGTLATGGAGESGGAVRSLSPLTLTGVDVLDSHAGGGRTLSGIVPGANGNPGGDGGGVWANQPVTVTDGSFVGDHAGDGSNGGAGTNVPSGSTDPGGPAGDGGTGGSGGAVAVSGGAALSVTGTTFRADHAGAGGAGGDGGHGSSHPSGIGTDGGAAGNGAGGGAGGAISATGPATLTGITTSDTQAGNGGDGGKGGTGGAGDTQAHFGDQGKNGDGGAGGSGGAVTGGAGTLTLSAAQLTAATAGSGGAGPQIVEPAPGGGAQAGRGGAGGAVSGGTVHVDHALISNASAGAGGMSATVFLSSMQGGDGGAGGGINGSSVTVGDSTITGSKAGQGGNGGQAQFADAGSGGDGGNGGGVNATGTLSLTSVTLDHDSAGDGGNGGTPGGGTSHANGGSGAPGGGVFANQGGSIANTTLNADAAGAGGSAGAGGQAGSGGNTGGIAALSASLTISHVTLTGNVPGAGGPAHGSSPAGSPGTIGAISGPAAVNSSIVAANTAPQCMGTANGSDNVSFPDASCGGANADPKLGSLADNGGPTKTQLPGPGSAALDTSSCTGTDQRGVPRPQGPACDSGAVETANPSVTADGGAFGSVSPGQAPTTTITVHDTFDPLHPQVSLSSPDFSLVSDGCSGTALAPATTCAVQVKFTAPAALGLRTATLHVTHDAAGPALDVPLSATVVVDTPPPVPDTTPPVLSHLTLAHKTFRVAKRKPAPKGTTIRFDLSEPASVKFTVTAKLPGRHKGKKCVAPTKRLRHAKHCTRAIKVGSFTRSAAGGRSSVSFNGRLNGRKLKPGSYKLTLLPTDPSGNRGAPVGVGFKIVKR